MSTYLAVSVGNSTGRAFTGAHGDGTLDSSGAANVAAWPSAIGSSNRGGSWTSTADTLRTSGRSRANGGNGERTFQRGIRGVRAAP
jgi:hypothetical protein